MTVLSWDIVTGDGTITGGAGTWSSATAHFTPDGGLSNQTAPSGAEVQFGGLGGVVTVNGVQTLSKLSSNAPGYRFEGDAFDASAGGLTLTYASPYFALVLANGLTGSATVTLTGAMIVHAADSTHTGTLIVANSTLSNLGTLASAVRVEAFSALDNEGSLSTETVVWGTLRNYGTATAGITVEDGGSLLNRGSISAASGPAVLGSAGNNQVILEAGTVHGDITLFNGNDLISIMAGALVTGTAKGGKGADSIVISGQVDGNVTGQDGDDAITVYNFGLVVGQVRGGSGNDYLAAGPRDARIRGDKGEDSLYGGAGNDRLYGGAKRDLIEGGDGNDRIYGGNGIDTLTGGAGFDRFIFKSQGQLKRLPDGRVEKITDFTPGGDLLSFSAIDADTTANGNQTFAWIGSAAFSGTPGELRGDVLTAATRITGDTDGDGEADLFLDLIGAGLPPVGDMVL